MSLFVFFPQCNVCDQIDNLNLTFHYFIFQTTTKQNKTTKNKTTFNKSNSTKTTGEHEKRESKMKQNELNPDPQFTELIN
jgi:hypothetical protein